MTDPDPRMDILDARVTRLTADLADLAAALTAPPLDGGNPPPPSPHPGQAVDPVYPTLTDWVQHYFCTTFARTTGGDTRWCPRWPDHPEAALRLEALWRAWETLRLDPNLGIVTWLTNYLDPQLAVLLARTGPFAQCTGDRHQVPGPLGSAM